MELCDQAADRFDQTKTAPQVALSLIGSQSNRTDDGPTVQLNDIPFGTTDWSLVERTRHAGERGFACWRTQQFGNVRVRMVEYSAGYWADHWCTKGHLLLCLAGDLQTELEDGRVFNLTPGTGYQVADNAEAHRSSTEGGATLFIVD